MYKINVVYRSSQQIICKTDKIHVDTALLWNPRIKPGLKLKMHAWCSQCLYLTSKV